MNEGFVHNVLGGDPAALLRPIPLPVHQVLRGSPDLAYIHKPVNGVGETSGDELGWWWGWELWTQRGGGGWA